MSKCAELVCALVILSCECRQRKSSAHEGGSPVLAKNGNVESTPIIRSGTFAGECVGYCNRELQITSKELVFEKKDGLKKRPTCRYRRSVESTEWHDLLSQVDRAALEALPNTIGCPDCADGGGEWLEADFGDIKKRLTFDRGADVPQVRQLLTKVRALEARLDELATP